MEGSILYTQRSGISIQGLQPCVQGVGRAGHAGHAGRKSSPTMLELGVALPRTPLTRFGDRVILALDRLGGGVLQRATEV